jgi:hypothetical protein
LRPLSAWSTNAINPCDVQRSCCSVSFLYWTGSWYHQAQASTVGLRNGGFLIGQVTAMSRNMPPRLPANNQLPQLDWTDSLDYGNIVSGTATVSSAASSVETRRALRYKGGVPNDMSIDTARQNLSSSTLLSLRLLIHLTVP